jgi:TolA-binding protein
VNEKKVVSRNVVIALGIVAVILLAGLAGAIANYTSIISGKDNVIATKDSQIQTLTNQKNQLQTWLDGNRTQLQNQINQLQKWLNDNITYYKNEIDNLYIQIINQQDTITNLQNQINSLKAPKLIMVDLKSEDNRPWLGTPYLHVYGYICNVGTNTAYNSKIHVVAYQSGGVVAIDTYITLGTIYGESWKSVDSNIYYSGSELVAWHLTLEWTS